jgi:tetratricopeptide (TPR) repeat protein
MGVAGCKRGQHGSENSDDSHKPLPAGSVTYTKDIAPIVLRNCASCHRPGQTAPFSLLDFADIRKRAKQIVEVTQSGFMPPWLPEKGYGAFRGERHLSDQQKGLLKQWAEDGCPEGIPNTTESVRDWQEGWLLGKPDMVLSIEKPFHLGPEGPDVYRNFLIALPEDFGGKRYVRGLEFLPGNPAAVHHAFFRFSEYGQARDLDGKDGQPGFPGMEIPGDVDTGHFLSWQPGRVPHFTDEGMNWPMEAKNDLVLQLHLKRTGKEEEIKSSIGLYFTNQPPVFPIYKLLMFSYALNIPAGESNYVARSSFTLPVDVEVRAILPHAHFLAQEMKSWATLPGGKLEWLLWIRHWNFRWQGDYQYQAPVKLPKGTTISMEYHYNNSAENPDNPHNPPRTVYYGPQTDDEMCELWFQLIPSRKEDLPLLQSSYEAYSRPLFMDYARAKIARNPNDAQAHAKLGILLTAENKAAALQELQLAVKLGPNLEMPHYYLGVLHRMTGKLPEAEQHLRSAIRLNARNEKAYGHLGFVLAGLGRPGEAEESFERALQLNPGDEVIQDALKELRSYKQPRKE